LTGAIGSRSKTNAKRRVSRLNGMLGGRSKKEEKVKV